MICDFVELKRTVTLKIEWIFLINYDIPYRIIKNNILSRNISNLNLFCLTKPSLILSIQLCRNVKKLTLCDKFNPDKNHLNIHFLTKKISSTMNIVYSIWVVIWSTFISQLFLHAISDLCRRVECVYGFRCSSRKSYTCIAKVFSMLLRAWSSITGTVEGMHCFNYIYISSYIFIHVCRFKGFRVCEWVCMGFKCRRDRARDQMVWSLRTSKIHPLWALQRHILQAIFSHTRAAYASIEDRVHITSLKHKMHKIYVYFAVYAIYRGYFRGVARWGRGTVRLGCQKKCVLNIESALKKLNIDLKL